MIQPIPEAPSEPCPEGAHDVALYVDGELAEADRALLEAHLDNCSDCRARATQALAFKRRLHRSAVERTALAPPALRARLRTALDAEPPPAPDAHDRPSWRRRWARPVPLAAGATALGLTAFFCLGPRTDDYAPEVVARHVRQLPLELQTDDPRVLESWLADKVDFRVRVPPPPRQLALVGARLSHVRDRSAVYLLYGDRQSPMHRVGVLVFDDPAGRAQRFGIPRHVLDQDVFTSRAAGYNVALWKANEVVYSVVGADADDEAFEFVRAVGR